MSENLKKVNAIEAQRKRNRAASTAALRSGEASHTQTLAKLLRKKTRGLALMKACRALLWTAAVIGAGCYGFLWLRQTAVFGLVPSRIREVLMLYGLPGALGLPVLAALLTYVFGRGNVKSWIQTIENEYPHLRDRLRTFAELSATDLKGNAAGFSRVFYRGLEEEIMAILSRFHFGRMISLDDLRAPFRLLAFILLLMGVHALSAPEFYIKPGAALTVNEPQTSMFRKAFVKEERLPHFSFDVIPGHAVVEKGSNLLIQVRMKDYEPKRVQVYQRSEEEHTWKVVSMKFSSGGLYQYTMNRVQTPMTYYIKVDHQKSPQYNIKIHEALHLEKAVWNIKFPAYMGIADQQRHGWHESLEVPQGTELKVELKFNDAVQTVTLSSSGKVFLPLKSKDSNQAEGVFRAVESKTLKLEAVSIHKESLKGLPPVKIQVLPDMPPYIEVLEPQIQNYVFATEEIPFEITLNDDYNLGDLTLVIRSGGGKEERISWFPKGQSGNQFTLKPVLRLEDFKLHPKDVVYVYLEVSDNYPGPESHIVKSPLFVFLIRDYAEQFKLDFPENEMPSLRMLFENVLAEQENLMRDTWDVLSASGLSPASGEGGTAR